jgi:predicted metal-dependent phosphoesterase TrpH
LLALNVTEKIEPNLPLFETLMKVGDLGGFCIAPHPMAEGLGMSSLDGYTILKAIRNADAARILIGIESYNATLLKKISNHYARILANRLNITQTASSDAHVLEAIGLGMTEFEGHTAAHLIKALFVGKTHQHKKKEWNSARILGSWAANYVGSTFSRLANAF